MEPKPPTLKERLKNDFSFFKGNYAVLIFSWILMDFAGELPGTYYSDYVIQLGGTATIIGIITAVSLFCLASVQFLGGYLADKYGRRWLISTLTFGIGLSFIFFAIAPSEPLVFMGFTVKGWHFILLGAAIQNLCLLYQPALFAMMADSVPPEKRGMGFSLVNLIMSVSTTPAPIVALMLVTIYGSLLGMRIAYAIVIVLYLAAAVVRLRLKESMKNAEKMDVHQMVRSYPQAVREGISIWKKVHRSARFLFLSELLARSAMALTQMLILIYAFYVLRIGGIPTSGMAPELDPALQQARILWGYVMTVLFLSMIALSVPIGKMLDRVGRKIPLVISNMLVIPSTLILIYGNYLTLYIALPLFGFSALLTFSSYQALFADLVPQAQRGKVTGSNHFFTYTATAIAGALGGFLYDAVAPQTPFLLMIILTIPSTAILLLRVQEPKPEERQP